MPSSVRGAIAATTFALVVSGLAFSAGVVARAPQPATPAELVITTQPDGARVTVNGVGWGTSPVTIRHLPPGSKRIRVTKHGYTAGERSITIDEGARRAVRIDLDVERGL